MQDWAACVLSSHVIPVKVHSDIFEILYVLEFCYSIRNKQCHQLGVLLNIPEGLLGFSIHPRRVFSSEISICLQNR